MKEKIDLYFSLLRIRIIEQTIAKNYNQGKMRCPVHLSIGQEAIPVGICSNLTNNDQIVSAHRSHAHYLAKNGNLKSMLSELYGKKTGCAGGIGGSMHLIDPDVGMVAAVPIVGSSMPIAVGLAWANKLKNSKNVVVVFFGDGAIEEGSFHESLNFASLNSLLILFVCENNNFSVYTKLEKRQSSSRKISQIAAAHGITSLNAEGSNVYDISEISQDIISNIREKGKPYFIELETFRHLEHCGPSNDDNLSYRDVDYVENWMEKDPLLIAQDYLLEKKLVDLEQISTFKRQIEEECTEAFKYAEMAPFPEKDELFNNLYSL
jgi:TPP-dependent pyruvate/acetoin dehydrogenase alpha subunit